VGGGGVDKTPLAVSTKLSRRIRAGNNKFEVFEFLIFDMDIFPSPSPKKISVFFWIFLLLRNAQKRHYKKKRGGGDAYYVYHSTSPLAFSIWYFIYSALHMRTVFCPAGLCLLYPLAYASVSVARELAPACRQLGSVILVGCGASIMMWHPQA
jgi:hypothetical protein